MRRGKFAVPPDLTEALEMHRRDASAQLRVALPGEIITYSATKRTASIKLCYNRVYNDGTVKPISCPLVDVPVVTLQGGGVHLGMPIGVGDECLVIFADINIDAWHAAGGQQTPLDQRRHDIADGFAIVGPNSLAHPVLTALTATEGGISTASAKVAVNNATHLIKIANTSKNLATILTALATQLSALTTTLGSMTTGSIAAGTTQATIAAQTAAITALIVDLALLLY